MSIPTPAPTAALPRSAPVHTPPVPPGKAGPWSAPAVWKTRTIRWRLTAPASRRVSHTALDGPERRPYAPQARSLYSSKTTSRVGSRTPVAKPMGGTDRGTSLCSDEPFTFAGFRVHHPRIWRSTSPECASTLLTSNRPVEDWGKLLGDTAAVTALLDRLLHHAHVLKCGPRSWRTKVQALRTQEAVR